MKRVGGYVLRVYEAPTFGEPRWSSSAGRAALEEGDVASANETLGSSFVLRGRVEHGDARGGEPRLRDRQLATEAFQVGAARRYLRRSGEDARSHVAPRRRSLLATRPQFYENGPLLVEVHLPASEGDLYDRLARTSRFWRVFE